MNDPVIVGFGEVVFDHFEASGRCRLGGAPANFAYHAGAFGAESHLVSALGRDERAGEIRRALAAIGMEQRALLPETDYPTGLIDVPVRRAGESQPGYVIRPDQAWDFIPFTGAMRELAARCDLLCFGTLAQSQRGVTWRTLRDFAAAMPRKSMRLCDLNLRQRVVADGNGGWRFTGFPEEVAFESLGLCDLLKINETELGWLLRLSRLERDGSEPVEACRALMERYGLRGVILTRGARDSYVVLGGEVSHRMTRQLELPAAEIHDVGAGDSFTATLCAALLEGYPLSEAHRFAVEVSARVCTVETATPADIGDFMARLRRGGC